MLLAITEISTFLEIFIINFNFQFLWTMGVIFSNIAVHLIIAQMSSTRSETVNGLLQLYLIVAGLSCAGFLGNKEVSNYELN